MGVCIVWNLEPLASGGQSGHKLIPHIICQFLYAREKKKLWTRTYSTRDQVPVCPVFTRAKIKSRFGIFNNLPSHLWYVNILNWKLIILDDCFDRLILTIFTNLSARAGYDTTSVFKRSFTDLNSEFSFS